LTVGYLPPHRLASLGTSPPFMGARKGAKFAAVDSSPRTKWGRGAERSEAVRGRGASPKAIDMPTLVQAQLNRTHKHVLLLSKRELQHTLRREIVERHEPAIIGNRFVIEANGASLDMAARLTVRPGKPGGDEQR
jgi:hypothetical protein